MVIAGNVKVQERLVIQSVQRVVVMAYVPDAAEVVRNNVTAVMGVENVTLAMEVENAIHAMGTPHAECVAATGTVGIVVVLVLAPYAAASPNAAHVEATAIVQSARTVTVSVLGAAA